jgi:tetratricopeptide (TPR) repeat protein
VIVRISTRRARLAILAAAVLVALWLSYFGIRTAVAKYESDKDTERSAQIAVRLEPGNFEYWHFLGRHAELSLEHPSPDLARQYFKKAISLNPLATDAWLDLATLEELDGHPDDARDAYNRAQIAYPIWAYTHWRYGNFLLRQGDWVEAKKEIRRAVELEPTLATQAFTRVYHAKPNVTEIADDVLPPKQSVYIDAISELVNENQLTDAEILWSRLMTLNPKLTVNDVDKLVSHLGLAGEISESWRVWCQGLATMKLPSLHQIPGSLVWDPSFETDIKDKSFSWNYTSGAESVLISLDGSEQHSGRQSLRLSFDGKHNPGQEIVWTRGAVEPGRKYHLTGWIKTKDITGSSGIRLFVRSVEDHTPRTSTLQIIGTAPWTLVDQTWIAGPKTHTVLIGVIREASEDPTIRISGSAWIDDVNLVTESVH